MDPKDKIIPKDIWDLTKIEFFIEEMKNSGNAEAIPKILNQYLNDYFSKDIEIGKIAIFAIRFIDEMYRFLMKTCEFYNSSCLFFSLVIPNLWIHLKEKGVYIFYILDNTLREDRFKQSCDFFSLSGVSVVTPYSVMLHDDEINDEIDRKRVREKRSSIEYAVEAHSVCKVVSQIGYFPPGQYLTEEEVGGLIRHYMQSKSMIAYIEKDASVNYMDRVIEIGQESEYICVFRNEGSDSDKIDVLESHAKTQVIWIDPLAY